MESCLALFLCLFVATAHSAEEWSYHGDTGPQYWSKNYEDCGGTSQSPVNIITAEVTEDTSLGAIKMSAQYSTKPTGSWLMNNNGHSVGIATNTGSYSMSEGGLGATYKLAQFHFHWGSVNWQGSEHTINGKMYPLEVHFVHYNTKYANIGTALDKPDGLAVLGFFFEIDGSDNPGLQPVVSNLTEVTAAGSEINIDPMNLMDLMGGSAEDLKDFYRYSGSLTTPGCYESVTWTVFDKVLKVSSAQMAKFRSLKMKDGEALVDNYRPVLPLHDRTIYSSHTAAGKASSASIAPAFILLTIALAFSRFFS